MSFGEKWSAPPLVSAGPSPEELESARIQAWLDEQARQHPAQEPQPYYAQPSWWLDTVIRQAMAPPPQYAPAVVVQEELVPWWAWALGGAAVVIVVKALR